MSNQNTTLIARCINLACISVFFFLLFNVNAFSDNNFKKFKLSNGLTVILKSDSSSSLISASLWVRTGSAFEGKYLGSGLSHLVEHMVFKGTSDESAGNISDKFQALGGEMYAFTSNEYTAFGITVPSENIKETMDLMHFTITEADFRDEELVKEKDVIKREMALGYDNPGKYISRKFWELAFEGHPYGVPVIGNEAIFDQVKREDVLEYYSTNYVPSNMILVIVGDFDYNNMSELVEQRWGTLEARPFVSKEIPQFSPVKGERKTIIKRRVSYPYLLLGFYGPNISSKDMYPMDVIAQICTGGKDSRLIKKMRDTLGVVTSVNAWSYTPFASGVFGVNANLSVSDWEPVQETILNELYLFKTSNVSDKELSKAKKQMIHDYLSGLETISGQARELATNEIYARNPGFTQDYLEKIKKVTADDIRKAANKYFTQDNLSLVVMEDSEELADTVVPKDIQATIHREELKNGIRLVYKEDHSLPLVTIRFCALGGLLEEEISGLSFFISQLWLKCNPDLVKRIEEVGGSISSYSGHNSFGFSISVLSEDINLALNVGRELIESKKIISEKVDLVRKLQAAYIKQEEDMPSSYSFKMLKKTFYGTHPYSNTLYGDLESILAISEEDIVNFRQRTLVSKNMVIAVFGDVNPKDLELEFKKLFGKISKKEFIKEDNLPQIKPEIQIKRIQKDLRDTFIIVGYPGCSIYDNERYALMVLDRLFSGMSGRLYEKIREESALSYSLGAFNFTGIEPGVFAFYVKTEEANIDKVLAMLGDEVEKIKTTQINEEELTSIKTYLLTQIQKEWESTSSLSLQVALDELYGLGYDYYKEYKQGIMDVTASQVKETANKYFNKNWNTTVVILPKKANQEFALERGE